MIEVAGEVNLLVRFISAANRSSRKFVNSRRVARINTRVEQDLLAAFHSLLQFPGLAKGNHETEGLCCRKAVQVPPANQSIVFLPPG